jgi:hypothetical protein
VTLPDGIEKKAGDDIFRYYSKRISAEVFAKVLGNHHSWGKACAPAGDSLSCEGVESSHVLHSTFDLEPLDPKHRQACWEFANSEDRPLMVRLVTTFTLTEVKNGFITFLRQPSDSSPLFGLAQAACACSSDDKNLTLYLNYEPLPSSGFVAKRGDVIDVHVVNRVNDLGVPDSCSNQLPNGHYHVKIRRIYPFAQPADYKTVMVGEITSDKPTDLSRIFHPR